MSRLYCDCRDARLCVVCRSDAPWHVSTDGLQQVDGNRQAGHHDADHAHQLDEDVQGRAGGVLEGIAHGVAHDGGFVVVRALAAEVAFLDILLGVVPGTTDRRRADRAHRPRRGSDP